MLVCGYIIGTEAEEKRKDEMINYEWNMIESLFAGVLGGLVGPAILFLAKSKITAYFNRNLSIEIEEVRSKNAERLQHSKELLVRRIGPMNDFRKDFEDMESLLSDWNYTYLDNPTIAEKLSERWTKNQLEIVRKLKEIKGLMPLNIRKLLSQLQYKIQCFDDDIAFRNQLLISRYRFGDEESIQKARDMQHQVQMNSYEILNLVTTANHLMDEYLFAHESKTES